MNRVNSKMVRMASMLVVVVLTLVFASAPATARTIIITDEDSDRMASIALEAPRQSWASYEVTTGYFINMFVDIYRNRPFLLRIPIDKIPPDQKITKAELLIPVNYLAGTEVKLYVWRLVGDWGPGVCYQYRTTRPKPVEWAMPGAKGAGTDRAPRPTAVAKLATAVETAVNVTEDVDLWYNGVAKNRGWLFTVEDDVWFRTLVPCHSYKASWKLRVTYEPK